MTARTIRNTEDDGLFEQSLELLERVFGESRSYYRMVRELDPLVERSDSLVVVVDGRVVGHLQVLPREMRVGRAILRVAGLACLAVDPAEHGKGHERALIEAALRHVMSGGYHLAMVFAADDAPYGEFGWETLPVDTYVARLGESGEMGPAPPDVRRMDPVGDLAWVAAVHGGYGSSCSGALVRSLGWWSGNMKWMREDPESSFVLERRWANCRVCPGQTSRCRAWRRSRGLLFDKRSCRPGRGRREGAARDDGSRCQVKGLSTSRGSGAGRIPGGGSPCKR